MKKLGIIFLLFIFFSVPVCASRTSEMYYENLLDDVGSETKDLLENFGLENGTYEEILNMNFDNIVRQFLAMCRNEMTEPLSAILRTFLLLIVLTVIQSLASADDSVHEMIAAIGTVILAFSLFVSIADCVSSVLSAGNGTSDFTKVLIPVLASIVSVAGKPTLALCFQSFCFSAAQGLTSLFNSSLPGVCSVYTSLSVCGCVSAIANTEKLAELIKKGYTMLLSLASVLFSALLSVKSVIAGCADSVAIKGAKFIVGNAVPVVGGALADALNSVITGISLLKSTIGIMAIMILVFINLPTLIELLMWSIALKLLNAVAGLLGRDNDCKLIAAFESIFSIMGAVLIFQVFLYIIAVSLLIMISGMG